MALVTLRQSAAAEAPLNVISAESDGGTSATFVGGDIQPFTGIVIDTTFADTQWHAQQCVTEVALPANIPRAGGGGSKICHRLSGRSARKPKECANNSWLHDAVCR